MHPHPPIFPINTAPLRRRGVGACTGALLLLSSCAAHRAPVEPPISPQEPVASSPRSPDVQASPSRPAEPAPQKGGSELPPDWDANPSQWYCPYAATATLSIPRGMYLKLPPPTSEQEKAARKLLEVTIADCLRFYPTDQAGCARAILGNDGGWLRLKAGTGELEAPVTTHLFHWSEGQWGFVESFQGRLVQPLDLNGDGRPEWQWEDDTSQGDQQDIATAICRILENGVDCSPMIRHTFSQAGGLAEGTLENLLIDPIQGRWPRLWRVGCEVRHQDLPMAGARRLPLPPDALPNETRAYYERLEWDEEAGEYRVTQSDEELRPLNGLMDEEEPLEPEEDPEGNQEEAPAGDVPPSPNPPTRGTPPERSPRE